ncbi:MAG: type II toxin-antitoxin system PemK/MazF family toxin [Planctomycetes bacterium]|nr:type II toxin-antitoxin system PemK/MazF family toxin [Planctomycetota bacterium]MBI3846557.1 type II toxin-antitoxin system PemK/MazF family toxin [Planctomycetota bacterium]
MGAPPVAGFPRRGEVYLVRLDPTIGAEMKKTRPALVVQNDIGNEHSATTIVAPISSTVGPRIYPTEVLLVAPEGGLADNSAVRLDQVRTVDKRRLGQRLGRLRRETMTQVDLALQISLGLVDV